MATTQNISYTPVEGWEQLPKGYAHRDVAGVAVDGEDRVYLMCRAISRHHLLPAGNFKSSWAKAISHIALTVFTSRPTARYSAPTTGQLPVRQFTAEASADDLSAF